MFGDTVIGAGLWYDYNDSEYDQIFQQGSFTLEMLRDDISVRVHGFVPIGTEDRVVVNNVVHQNSIVSFSGNDLVLDLLAINLTGREVALKGIDVDIAHSISDYSAEAFAGYYNFQGKYGGQAHGVKGGVRGYLTENIAASATVSNDKFFGTNVFGGFTWFFGGGRVMPQTVEDKLYIPTERNTQVPIRHIQDNTVTTTSVALTQNGNPINITHVGGADSGSGSFESPLGRLLDANGTDSEIILVYANTQFFGQSIQLKPGQRLLGEADGVTHFVDTDQLGTIPLPRVTNGIAPLIGDVITPLGGQIGGPQSNPIEMTGIEFVPTITGTSIQSGLVNPDDLPGQGTQPTTWQLQRSDLRTIEVEFSESIQVSADDLRLTNLGINADLDADTAIDMNNATVTVTGSTVRIQFVDALPDGVYQLDVLPTATDLAGNPIDGNGDGFPGDGFSLVGNSTNRLFQLSGDFNGDSIVDNDDVTTFQYWFRSTTEPQGGNAPDYVDLDADGGIGIGDNGDVVPGVEFEFESSTGSFIVEPGDTFDVSVSYSVTAGQENMTIVQLNFDGSELGSNQLTLDAWSSNPAWILPLDNSLSTPTDNSIAITAGFAPNSTAETEIGTFRITAPSIVGNYRLTLNSVAAPPNETGIAGAISGPLPIVNFADIDIIVNNPPTAGDDNYVAPEDSGPLLYDVLSNDTSSPDAGETLSLIDVSPASHGTVTISNGSLRYTPDDDYFGTETFTYTVSDGKTSTDVGTVSLSITPVNDEPVLGNDSHAPDPVETLTLLSLGSLPNGAATIVGNSISYTPATDFTGTETFTYTLQDGDGATAQGTVTVSVQDMTSPTISGIEINANITDPTPLPKGLPPTSWSQQRSSLNTIVVTLSEDIRNVSPSDLTLTNLGANAPVDADTLVSLQPHHISVTGNVLTLTFETNELENGVYSLTLHSTIRDLANLPLDGDGDGSGGDSYEIRGNATNAFYRQIADFSGDTGVSVFDFTTFSYWFGTSVPVAPDYVDLNRDGGISVFDFSFFSQNFGRGVIYPVAFANRIVPSNESADPFESREATRRTDRAIDQLIQDSEDIGIENNDQRRRAHDSRLILPRSAANESLELALDEIAADIAEIFN